MGWPGMGRHAPGYPRADRNPHSNSHRCEAVKARVHASDPVIAAEADGVTNVHHPLASPPPIDRGTQSQDPGDWYGR